MLKNTIIKLKKSGKKFTLLGIGPVSETVIRSAMKICKSYDYPLILIASRNQVDLESLGSGYLMGGMDQFQFVDLISRLRKEIDYKNPVHICRDHGGPWQRNIELDEKYSVGLAMDIAKKSFSADIRAGFTYIHIDPTKCPFSHTLDDICNWTVDLLEYCEKLRVSLGKDPIDYEVGTEDIQGGLTSSQTFETFLKKLIQLLKIKNLPLPTCIVAQTGTLVRVDRNVGHFNSTQTEKFIEIANRYGIELKEHNGDYLDVASCRVHPHIGIAVMNVAPEFGLVETDAYLYLAQVEKELVDRGILSAENSSNLQELFIEITWKIAPWQKWMTEEIKKLSYEEIKNDASLRLLIARVCGHYIYNTKEIKKAREKLYSNLKDPKYNGYLWRSDMVESFAEIKIKNTIEFYIKNFWER